MFITIPILCLFLHQLGQTTSEGVIFTFDTFEVFGKFGNAFFEHFGFLVVGVFVFVKDFVGAFDFSRGVRVEGEGLLFADGELVFEDEVFAFEFFVFVGEDFVFAFELLHAVGLEAGLLVEDGVAVF